MVLSKCLHLTFNFLRDLKILSVQSMAVFILLLCASAVQAQEARAKIPSTSQESIMGELLTEVRQLRRVVQQSNLQTYRTQVTLGQLRVQQEHVDRLARDLVNVQDELTDIRQDKAQNTERLKDFEEKSKLAVDDDRLLQIVKDLHLELDELAEKEQIKRVREGQITGQLQLAQNKLDWLNSTLETLERGMESINAENESKPRKTQP